MFLHILADIWSLSIRDTGLACFTLAALAAAAAALASPRSLPRRLWWVVAFGFAVMVGELLLDWRFQISEVLRQWVRREQAIDQFTAQATALIAGGVACLVVFAGLVFVWRRCRSGAVFGSLGLLIVLAGTVVEIVSFHDFHEVLYRRGGPIPVILWVWLAGAAVCIAAAAVSFFFHRRRRASDDET